MEVVQWQMLKWRGEKVKIDALLLATHALLVGDGQLGFCRSLNLALRPAVRYLCTSLVWVSMWHMSAISLSFGVEAPRFCVVVDTHQA